ncbi:hypothetical protein LIER_15818 [Lithospermum erythrorhizon]|uniref:Uncharacterized protein n=1 Tax=Lithospermum erythrorhizon TaxID=34254 RepID=A0AAV3Q5X9_LITER
MAIVKLVSTFNSIAFQVPLNRGSWIYSCFVTSTRPLQDAKIDKQTAEKIKEAAETVTEGAKTVIHVGKSIEGTIQSSAKNAATEVAKKAFDKVTNTEEKTAWEKTKDATQNIKDKIVGK